MRTIDADSLKKEIGKLFPNKMPCDYTEEDNDLGAILCDVKEIIDKQPTIDDWVSCSERLPKRERGELLRPYLVCTDRGGCAIARYDGRWKVSGSVKVIAWKELPDSYEEK